MRLQLQSAVLFVGLSVSLLSGRTHAVDAPAAADTLQDSSVTVLEFPLIVRIDHSALDSLEDAEINHRGRVDRMVLGTHAVGDSLAKGAMSVVLNPDRDEASFDIAFRGTTSTNTVGTNGPAVIRSHTKTKFTCTRPVTYDPLQGFVAGPSKIVATTNLVYDGFESARGGLGSRIISRAAEKRAQESKAEAQRIAKRDCEHELQIAFDKQVNKQLAALNQQLNLAIYKKLFVGEDTPIQLAARSSSECIQIGMGKGTAQSRLTVSLPQRNLVAPIEIWVHSTLLGEPMTKRIKLMESWKKLPQLARLDLLQALLIPSTESDRLVDLTVEDGWIVFGLQQAATEVAKVAINPAPIEPSAKPPHGE